MVERHGTHDLDNDLRPLGSYALASVLGCAFLCVALVAVVCCIWAAVAWL